MPNALTVPFNEEYIDYHEDELLDPEQFNVGLMQHLIWHNIQRPHWSLKMKPPVQFIQDNFSHPECNMYVADTSLRRPNLYDHSNCRICSLRAMLRHELRSPPAPQVDRRPGDNAS